MGAIKDDCSAKKGAMRWYAIGKQGNAVLRTCDRAVTTAYDEFFAPLSGSLRATLLSGSLVTSSYLGLTRMEGARYFAEYSVLEGILKNEQYIKKTTQAWNLTIGEYRVLLLLMEHPNVNTHKAMREYLVAHPSELSQWCKALIAKGLLVTAPNPADKRGVVFTATADGLQKASEIVSEYNVHDVRPTEANEIPLYNGMFRIIMDNMRKKRQSL